MAQSASHHQSPAVTGAPAAGPSRRKLIPVPLCFPRTALVDLAFLAGFWLLYFWPLLIRREYLIPYDIIEQHYMFQAFAHRAVLEGQSSWWAPHILSGYPLVADPLAMLFYPPALVMHALAWRQLLLPYLYLEWLAALHYLWAAAGTYLLARSLTSSRAGAILAALTYSSGAFFAMHLPHLSAVAGLSWLPWILLAFRRVLSEPGPIWIGVAGLAFGMMVLAGHALTALQIGYLLLILTLLAAWRSEPGRAPATETPIERGGRRPIARAHSFWRRLPAVLTAARRARGASLRVRAMPPFAGFAALVLGTGVAMVQLVPSWELANLTERANFPYEEAVVSSIQPHWLLTLVLPNIFATKGPAPYWGSGDPAETNLYAGLLPLFLAPLALVRAERGDRRATVLLLVGALLALVLAFGAHTWVYRIAYDLLPGVDRVRRPTNYVALFHFALALLAAYGVKALEREPAGGDGVQVLRRWLQRALLVTAAVLGLATLLLARSVGNPNHQVMQAIADGLVVAGLVMLATFIAVLARIHWHLSATAFLVVLVGIAAFDLGTATAHASYRQHRMRPDSYIGLDWAGDPGSPVVRWLLDEQQRALTQRYRILPKRAGSIWDNGPLVWGIDSAWGYTVLWPVYYRELFDAATADLTSPLLNLLNVRYVLTSGPIEEVAPSTDPDRFALIQQGSPWIYENRSVGPRVWIATRAAHVADRQQIAFLTANHASLRDLVTLSETEPLPDGVSPGQGHTSAAGHADILRYETTRVLISVRSDQPGFLVLADTYYPGWRATVDGRPAAVYRANHAFRAVWVPAGEHLVEFRFEPTSLRLGASLTLLSALAMTGLVLLALVRRIQARDR
jgi:hypothetical protein